MKRTFYKKTQKIVEICTMDIQKKLVEDVYVPKQ